MKKVNRIECSLFNIDQYISKNDLWSNFIASLYSNSFNSKLSSFSLFVKLNISELF